MFLLCTSGAVLVRISKEVIGQRIGRSTSVEAVQPSGKIQPLGLDPWIRHGLEDVKVHEITIDNVFTSIVKQCPGIMIPGSSLPELVVQHSNLIDS